MLSAVLCVLLCCCGLLGLGCVKTDNTHTPTRFRLTPIEEFYSIIPSKTVGSSHLFELIKYMF